MLNKHEVEISALLLDFIICSVVKKGEKYIKDKVLPNGACLYFFSFNFFKLSKFDE